MYVSGNAHVHDILGGLTNKFEKKREAEPRTLSLPNFPLSVLPTSEPNIGYDSFGTTTLDFVHADSRYWLHLLPEIGVSIERCNTEGSPAQFRLLQS